LYEHESNNRKLTMLLLNGFVFSKQEGEGTPSEKVIEIIEASFLDGKSGTIIVSSKDWLFIAESNPDLFSYAGSYNIEIVSGEQLKYLFE